MRDNYNFEEDAPRALVWVDRIAKLMIAVAGVMLLIGVVLLALQMLASPAEAQGIRCFSPLVVVETLGARFGEVAILGAEARGGSVIHLWLNAETGTWTLTNTKDAQTCLLFSGTQGLDFSPLPTGVEG